MKKLLLLVTAFTLLFASNTFAADSKTQSRPPSNVVTSMSASGMLSPTTPFVGTAQFTDVSSVAAETSGKIVNVRFEEGDTVSRGSVLAVIDSVLLEKSLAEAEAGLERIEANLQLANNDYERTAKLYKESATSEQSYDNKKFAAIALEKQKSAQYAAIANLQAQLSKKVIYAPFDGVIVSRNTSVGEWVNSGSVVAEVAKTGEIDIKVNVPERLLQYLSAGLKAETEIAGRQLQSVYLSTVPAGDTTNRTFPVKFRIKNAKGLLQGMEAKVSLPMADKTPVIFIDRDAMVSARGNVFVYTIENNTAKMIPVQVVGYAGQKAGVLSSGLKADMAVIVKGNERLQPGQPVNVIGN